VLQQGDQQEAFWTLSRFRGNFYDCLNGRGDALFELADALLCRDGPVKTLVDLALAPEHGRGHGALYGGLNKGCMDIARLRRTIAGLPLPKAADGRLVLAVDVSPWLRPDAATCPDRSFCHLLRPWRCQAPDDPGPAVLGRGRAGDWPHLLDCGARRDPPGARR